MARGWHFQGQLRREVEADGPVTASGMFIVCIGLNSRAALKSEVAKSSNSVRPTKDDFTNLFVESEEKLIVARGYLRISR